MNGEFIKNLLSMIIAGITIISSIAIGIDYVFATKAELLFFGRKERMYNKMGFYLILTIELILVNRISAYLILKPMELKDCLILFGVVGVLFAIVFVVIHFKVKEKSMGEDSNRYVIMLFIICLFAICINILQQLLQVLVKESKVVDWVVLVGWSILEIVILHNVLFKKYMKEKASYYIELGRNKWYLHRRVDDFFMCGEKEEFKTLDEIKLIPIKYITDNGCILKKTSQTENDIA